jgi:thymidylate synthase (FAD)
MISMKVNLIWCTPEGDDLIAHMARVSNPANQDNKATAPKLIKYLIDHRHWSPFEMVNACVSIETTRDISRQILRHRSFSFQEFSGRYAMYGQLIQERDCRIQDKTNRQSSLPPLDNGTKERWATKVQAVSAICLDAYTSAIRDGVAKEVARALLPEGLVPTTMYMNGTLRSWIHYFQVRCTPETQKEHRLVAEATREAILPAFPMIAEVLKS